MAETRLCSIPDCGKKHLANGWCVAHYTRWKRNGDPLGGGTSHGELLRFYRTVVLPWTSNECLLWPYGRGGNGYADITINRKKFYVHRLACEHANGPAPGPAYEAAHACGKGQQGCVNPHHLSWKTPTENQADKLDHGTHNRGERQGAAKLTTEAVLAIRSLCGKESRAVLATRYGVSVSHIAKLQKRQSWDWLT